MVHCSILGCKSDSHHKLKIRSLGDSERKYEKITFHRFPRDIVIRNWWIKATGRYNWQPTKQTRVCSRHFETNCFRRSKKVTLLAYGSIPKLCIPLENDMENYMQYKIMGSVKRVLKKPNCIPSRFDCHANRKYKSTPSEPRPAFKKRERMSLIAEAEETLREIMKPTSSHNPGTLSERQQLKQEKSQIILEELLNSSKDLKSAMKELIATAKDSIETTNALPQEDVTLECRACYQKFDYDAGLVDLFQSWNPPWNGMADTIAEDLSRLTSIEVSFTDQYSKYICLMCHQKLLDACNFVANVRLNDRVIRAKAEEHSRQDTIWPKPIQVDKDVNSLILNNSMVVEVKQEVLSENEADDVNGIDDMYKESDFNSLDIKVEPEDIVEQPSIQITVNGTITNDQYAQNSMVLNGDCNLVDRNIEEVKVKEEPKTDDEDSEMVPDLPLECMLCTKNFNSVSGLKAHVVSQHSYKSVKRKSDSGSSLKKKNKHICATCRCSFATSTDLMVHETRHNAYACYVCNAKFDTFELLTKHRKKCKSAGSKTVQRPKTLEDVKRPQGSSPQISETSTPDSMNDDTKSTSSLEVHLKIHSISEKANTMDSEKDMEMKVEPLDSSFSEDEVIN